MIPRRLLLLCLPVSLLLGACAHKAPQVVYVQAPAALPPTDSNKVRVADRVHAYSVGRLPTANGLAMNEAHQYYRIEDSAQAQALTAEKNRVTADTYRTLLQTNQAENAQLRAENQRLRAAVDAPSTKAPAGGATPGPRDGTDPYERLKEWDQQSGSSPAPSTSPRAQP